MQHRRLALLLTALLILSLVLSACGPRPQQGELAKSSTSDTLVVDLPAINIDYGADGKATLSGVPLSVLGTALGQDLSSLDRSPEAIKKLTDAGIQNAFVNLTPSGLNVYANAAVDAGNARQPERVAWFDEQPLPGPGEGLDPAAGQHERRHRDALPHG